MRAGIILQVRMDSRRLPGKALELIGGRPMVDRCIRRLQHGGAAPVILATTTRDDDEVLAVLGRCSGIGVFRGAANDVLDRFVRCAAAYDLRYVIRATADNPAVDLDAPRRVLDALQRTGADYVREEGLPYGAAVEGITAAALTRAAALAREAADREHVTTFIRRRTDLFRAVSVAVPKPVARPDVRLTVDTWEDLQHMRQLYASVNSEMPTVAELIGAWDNTRKRAVA